MRFCRLDECFITVLTVTLMQTNVDSLSPVVCVPVVTSSTKRAFFFCSCFSFNGTTISIMEQWVVPVQMLVWTPFILFQCSNISPHLQVVGVTWHWFGFFLCVCIQLWKGQLSINLVFTCKPLWLKISQDQTKAIKGIKQQHLVCFLFFSVLFHRRPTGRHWQTFTKPLCDF